MSCCTALSRQLDKKNSKYFEIPLNFDEKRQFNCTYC